MGADANAGTNSVRALLRHRRVVVTGGAGFLGEHVVAALSAAGAEVLVLDMARPATKLARPHRRDVCDVRRTEAESLIIGFRPHIVVHLAAQVGVPTAVQDPAGDADVNVQGTIRVCQAASTVGAQLVFTASCAVYGTAPPCPVNETQPLDPSSPYGLSKATALSYVDYFVQQRDLAATSLVLGNVYGPGGAGVIQQFLTAAVDGQAATLRGQDMRRDYLHVDDVVAGVLRASVAAPAGRVNLGTGIATSVEGVHTLVQRATGTSIAPRREPALPGEAQTVCLDRTRAAQRLGWCPQWTLERGIAAAASVRKVVTTA